MADSGQKSTREFVPIKSMRGDGVVILKDGTLCSLLMASSLNFALKSMDEQEAILMQYQNFLNSLDFPVQIFVQSRKINIQPYLQTLEDAKQKQSNEQMIIQIREYISFIKDLVASTNIVSKNFYIVVPYRPPMVDIGTGGLLEPLKKILGGGKPVSQKDAGDDDFSKNKLQLDQRINIVQSGLSRAGIRTIALNSEEVVELFFKLFNPGEVDRGVVQTLISEGPK